MTHETWLAKLFNEHFAGAANSILGLFGITAANPAEPWADHMVMQLLVALHWSASSWS